MKQKVYLHHWLLPLNGLQDGTPYAGCTVGNSPKFMPLYNSLNSLNRYILKSLRFYCVLSLSIIDGKEIKKEERKLCFSFSTPREIAQGLKRLWDSKMGTPSSERIIQDVDLALKALEIVYRENGASVEGLPDRNGHKRKVVGKGKRVRLSDVEVQRPKVRVASANSPKRYSSTVICWICVLWKDGRSVSSSLTPLFFTIKKTHDAN